MTANNETVTIGALAEGTDCSVPTIRYYETIGLLPEAARKTNGQRVYAEGDFRRLAFIRRCREFGFSIDEIRALLALRDNPSRNCFEARDLAQKHLGDVQKKLAEMRALEATLIEFVDDCTVECGGGPASKCVILEDLANPQLRECCKTR